MPFARGKRFDEQAVPFAVNPLEKRLALDNAAMQSGGPGIIEG
jgi:hypothetical protein